LFVPRLKFPGTVISIGLDPVKGASRSVVTPAIGAELHTTLYLLGEPVVVALKSKVAILLEVSKHTADAAGEIEIVGFGFTVTRTELLLAEQPFKVVATEYEVVVKGATI
jgi:hypothetical protein